MTFDLYNYQMPRWPDCRTSKKCSGDIGLSENNSAENSPWGRGLLPAQSLIWLIGLSVRRKKSNDSKSKLKPPCSAIWPHAVSYHSVMHQVTELTPYRHTPRGQSLRLSPETIPDTINYLPIPNPPPIARPPDTASGEWIGPVVHCMCMAGNYHGIIPRATVLVRLPGTAATSCGETRWQKSPAIIWVRQMK